MKAYQPAPEARASVVKQPEPSSATALQQWAKSSPQAQSLSALQAMASCSPKVQSLAALQRMAETSPRVQQLQDTSRAIQRMDEEELLQGKAIQRAGEAAPRSNNTGLPDNLKAGIESLSGLSMDHVKVHRNSDKPAAVQAHAYAQGSEIHLGPGQEKHLPHEAWHVVQQAQGRVQPTLQAKGVAINDDPGLEAEADVMGARALQAQKEEGADIVEAVRTLQSKTIATHKKAPRHHSSSLLQKNEDLALGGAHAVSEGAHAVSEASFGGEQRAPSSPGSGVISISESYDPIARAYVTHVLQTEDAVKKNLGRQGGRIIGVNFIEKNTLSYGKLRVTLEVNLEAASGGSGQAARVLTEVAGGAVEAGMADASSGAAGAAKPVINALGTFALTHEARNHFRNSPHRAQSDHFFGNYLVVRLLLEFSMDPETKIGSSHVLVCLRSITPTGRQRGPKIEGRQFPYYVDAESRYIEEADPNGRDYEEIEPKFEWKE